VNVREYLHIFRSQLKISIALRASKNSDLESGWVQRNIPVFIRAK